MARSVFWRLAGGGDINEATGTDELITVTGIPSSTAIEINVGDGVWLPRTTLASTVGPLYFDDFETARADLNGTMSSSGHLWTRVAGTGVIRANGGHAESFSSATGTRYQLGPDDLGPDVSMVVGWAFSSTENGVRASFCESLDGLSAYRLYNSNGTLILARVAGGTQTVVRSQTMPDPRAFEVRKIGGLIEVLHEGVALPDMTYTDPSPLTGGSLRIFPIGSDTSRNRMMHFGGGPL